MRLDQFLEIRGYFFSFSEESYKITGGSMQALHITEEVTQARRGNAAAEG